MPEANYRTGIAIMHVGRMTEVLVTFTLSHRDGVSARYVAPCPRCAVGEIVVEVKLAADGGFAETPACPALCLTCEDALDAILEPDASPGIGEEPGDRATLSKYLSAMSRRCWD